MKKTITLLVSMIFVLSSFAQFSGQYTLNAGGDDYFNVLKRDGGLGFYLGGTIGQSGNYDASFIHTNGIVTTAFSYGSTGTEFGTYLTKLNDGNVLITGRSNSYNGANDHDVFLVKINPADGSVIWSKAIGTDSIEYGTKAINSHDGDILVIGSTVGLAGNSKTDMMVLKVSNTDGHVIFARKIGFQYSNDTPFDIVDFGDNILVIGFSGVGFFGMNEIVGVLLDSTAHINATMFYGGSSDEEGRIVNKFYNAEDEVYIAGTTGGFGAGSNDLCVLKLKIVSGLPTVVWFKTYGGTNNDNLTGFESNQQGFLLSGITNSFGSATDGLLVQIDTSGAVLWSKYEGSTGDDYFQYVSTDTANGLNLIVGYTNSFNGGSNNDGFLVVTNTSGLSGTCDGNTGITAQTHIINDSIQTGVTIFTSDTIAVTETNAGVTAVALTPTLAQVCPLSVGQIDDNEFAVYPNPFTGNLTISNNTPEVYDFEIFDINSKIIYKSTSVIGSAVVDLSGIPSGVYMLVCKNGTTVQRTKVVKY